MKTAVTREQIEERITGAVVSFGAERERFSRDAEFQERDVDSLDLVEMTQIVEDEYGVQMREQVVEDRPTAGHAVDFMAEPAAA